MTKTLIIAAAIGALTASTTLAQTPGSPPSSAPAPAPSVTASPPAAAAKAGKADFVMSQKPDQWLASKFKGTDVLGADNKKIGDVSDILFDKTGKIEAFVISVGGFLGVGAKEIAVVPSSFDVIPAQNGASAKLKLSLTEDEIKQAQNFARYEPPKPATTGSGPGLGGLPGNSRPSGSPPSSK